MNLTLIAQYSQYFIGFVMPFFVEAVNRHVSNSKAKFGVTLALCLVAAVLTNIPELKMGNVEDLLSSLTLIFTASQLTYKVYFKDSYLRQQMQRPVVVTQ